MNTPSHPYPETPDGRQPTVGATVVVGMSGGVDSSVAALLLKRRGWNVVGVFMKNWDETDERGECSATQDFADVEAVGRLLDIPILGVDFAKEYRDQVFEAFLQDYAAGFTPNPDVLCNREIKFKVFLEKARALGADWIATGHYCQTDGTGRLLKGADPEKDQSYFLAEVPAAALRQTLFPIGHLPKSEVRKIAAEAGLPTHDKKDSTGICFIGERKFRPFLSQFLALTPGDFRTLDGAVVGRHSGSAYFTLGQRRGLGLGGDGERWFVVDKDPKANVVYVERGSDHPALYSRSLLASRMFWISGSPPTSGSLSVLAKIRYRQADQPARLEVMPDGRTRIDFETPQRAITPGQYVVIYDALNPACCLGSARILARSHGDALESLYIDQSAVRQLERRDHRQA